MPEPLQPIETPDIALRLTAEEADVLLALLLRAPVTQGDSPERSEGTICRILEKLLALCTRRAR